GSCVYPQGINPKEMYYFNEEDIDKLIFEGFDDEDNQIYELEMKKILKKNAGSYTKGKVD
ncbi:MAG: DUF4176 domain-containing protein, partial [Mycoplasmatales bacterium]